MRKNSRTRYEPITYGGDEATRARIFWKRPCQRWTRKRSMRKILERSDKLVATTTTMMKKIDGKNFSNMYTSEIVVNIIHDFFRS